MDHDEIKLSKVQDIWAIQSTILEFLSNPMDEKYGKMFNLADWGLSIVMWISGSQARELSEEIQEVLLCLILEHCDAMIGQNER